MHTYSPQICMYTRIYTYIYIYSERERERERDMHICLHICIYVRTCAYMHAYMPMRTAKTDKLPFSAGEVHIYIYIYIYISEAVQLIRTTQFNDSYWEKCPEWTF